MVTYEVLGEFGLDEEEQAIYLHALKNGGVTQQGIAEATGLLRQTVYDRVRKLEYKGILTKTNEMGRPLFAAMPPNSFLQELKEKEQRFREILPTLQELVAPKQQVTSSTFKGLPALKKMMNLTLASREDILWIANKQVQDKIFTEHFWLNYAQRRLEKKIPLKLLCEPTKEQGWESNKKELRENRQHPFIQNQESSLVIFGNQLLMYTANKGHCYGIHIVDASLTRFFAELFRLLWEDAVNV